LPDRDPHDNGLVVFQGEGGEILTGQVVEPEDAILPPASGWSARVPPIPVGEILETVPDFLDAVRGGKIMRLISEPAGPLTKAKAGGVLGSVRGEKGFAQNLRYRGPPENVRVVAAPAAAFQIASAVTLQYYLNTITKQLESLQRGIGDIKEWLRAEELSDVESAEQSCSDIAAHMSAGTPLNAADLVKLNDAHSAGRRRFAAARTRLETLAHRIDEAVTETGDISNRGALEDALKDATANAVRDYQVLMHAAVLTVQALALLAAHDATEGPARLETTEAAALREIEKMRTSLAELMPYLNKLNIRKSAVAREYARPLKWGSAPYKELEVFRAATKDLRRHLREPSEALLPPLTAAQPWVIEARMAADGSIETRVQELEVAAAPAAAATRTPGT
jgi:hypothetical protein